MTSDRGSESWLPFRTLSRESSTALETTWLPAVAATMAAGDVPPLVASALHDLLDGNTKKVLISVFLWLPYLLLSRRVNVTFRNRIPIRRR